MSFDLGSWLPGVMVRLSGKRRSSTGTAVPHKDKERYCRGSNGQPPSRVTVAPLQLGRLEDWPVPVIVTLFNVRFTTNATGDTVILGNTLETASTVGNPGRTQQDVIHAQNGTGSFIDNHGRNMVHVNVDTATPGVFNSATTSVAISSIS